MHVNSLFLSESWIVNTSKRPLKAIAKEMGLPSDSVNDTLDFAWLICLRDRIPIHDGLVWTVLYTLIGAVNVKCLKWNTCEFRDSFIKRQDTDVRKD